MLKILMLEDVPEDVELIKYALQKEKISFVSYDTDNKQDFLKGLKEFEPDLVLSDYSLPLFNGLEALELVKEISPEIPFIMVTGSLNEETAVECMKKGAWDYVIKEHLTRLGYAVHNVLKLKEENDKIRFAEDELRKLSTAINQSPSAIIITNRDGIIEYVNPYFERIAGYSKQEVIGQNPRLLKSDKTPLETYEELWETIQSGNSWEGEFINEKKNGEYYWETAVITPVKNDNNEITNFIAIKHDITKRKKDEQIQKVLYNISNAAITTDNLKKLISQIQKELGIIIDTTNFYVALYDHKTDMLSLPFFADEKDEITSFPAGKTIANYVINTQKPLLATKKELKKLIESGDAEIFGTVAEVWLGVPLKVEGKVTGVLAIQSYTDEFAYDGSDMEMLEFVSDQISISIDRKKTEQELKSALEKATESDRLKSAFLATMSHELRTPLNAIIGFSGLINKNLPIDSVIKYANTVNSSGEDLLSIVEDLFDITLIESGMSNIKISEVNLHAILLDLFEVLKIEQFKTNKSNIEFNHTISIDANDLIIKTDPTKLKQILGNLLKNALKFTHVGHIRYGYSIEQYSGKPMLKFYVEDTGIGIHEDKYEIIFEVFRQGDDSHTRMYGGTGIGLSISKKLTEFLGGKIWFESEVGNGSTFYFTLPFDQPGSVDESNELIIKTEKNKNLKNKTILIVEDDEASYDFLRIILELHEVKIIWAKGGRESINLCKENSQIDLVLMDINMPDMNGYEATKEIKMFSPVLPIIAQTAYAIAGDREKAIDVGCDDYISKPIDKEILYEMLSNHLEKVNGI